MSPNTTPSAARAVSARRPFDCVCAAVAWFDILLFPSRLVRLALRPAHSRRHLYVTCYTEGFSHFVTSMTAPVASGWSVRRMGLAPTGKRRLLTAHANSGHWKASIRLKAVGRPCAKIKNFSHRQNDQELRLGGRKRLGRPSCYQSDEKLYERRRETVLPTPAIGRGTDAR